MSVTVLLSSGLIVLWFFLLFAANQAQSEENMDQPVAQHATEAVAVKKAMAEVVPNVPPSPVA